MGFRENASTGSFGRNPRIPRLGRPENPRRVIWKLDWSTKLADQDGRM